MCWICRFGHPPHRVGSEFLGMMPRKQHFLPNPELNPGPHTAFELSYNFILCARQLSRWFPVIANSSYSCTCVSYLFEYRIHWWFLPVSMDMFVQSCPTLCDPMDYSLPGSSVYGIFQARILEWVAISLSRGSSQSRDWTQVSCTAGRLYHLSHQGSPRLFTLPITSFCEKVFILTQSKFKRIDSIVYHIGSPSSCVLDWNKFMNILYYPWNLSECFYLRVKNPCI